MRRGRERRVPHRWEKMERSVVGFDTRDRSYDGICMNMHDSHDDVFCSI